MPNNTVDVTEGPHVVMEKVDKRDATFLKNHCCFLSMLYALLGSWTMNLSYL